MKKVLTILILTALAACNETPKSNRNDNNQEAVTAVVNDLVVHHSWADFHLQGKVKKLTEYNYYLEEDANGNPVQGGLIEEYEPITITEFNEQGNIIHTADYNEEGGEPTTSSEYQYDNQNRLIAIKRYTGAGDLLSTERYEYTPEGYLSSFTNTYIKTEITKMGYTTAKTPEGVKVVEQNLVQKDANQYTVKLYNAQNLLAKETFYEQEKPQTELRYFYNAANLLEKTENEGFGDYPFSIVTTFTCDTYGNVTKMSLKSEPLTDDAELPDTVYQYNYDGQGNVVRKVSKDVEIPSITVYKIEYY